MSKRPWPGQWHRQRLHLLLLCLYTWATGVGCNLHQDSKWIEELKVHDFFHVVLQTPWAWTRSASARHRSARPLLPCIADLNGAVDMATAVAVGNQIRGLCQDPSKHRAAAPGRNLTPGDTWWHLVARASPVTPVVPRSPGHCAIAPGGRPPTKAVLLQSFYVWFLSRITNHQNSWFRTDAKRMCFRNPLHIHKWLGNASPLVPPSHLSILIVVVCMNQASLCWRFLVHCFLWEHILVGSVGVLSICQFHKTLVN